MNKSQQALLALALVASVFYIFNTEAVHNNLASQMSGQRKASKIEYTNCVLNEGCQQLDCHPDASDAQTCLAAKIKYMSCTWDNVYCGTFSDAMDNLGWNEYMPDDIYKCWDEGQCQISKEDSYSYFYYQKCYRDCLWVEV